VKTIRTYKTEINPTTEQIKLIHKTFGCTRYIYNRFISDNFESLNAGNGFISAYTYSKKINNDPDTPSWLKEVPSKAIKQALIYADGAFRNYFNNHKGKPTYKKKSSHNSFYLIGTIKVERHRIFVPVLKWIRLKEFGYIPANISSVTISMKNDRYYISCLCKDETVTDERIPLSDYNMGIDFGLRDQFITEHKVISSVNKTQRVKKLEKQLRRAQRALSRKYEANMTNKVYYETGVNQGQLKSYQWVKPLTECKNIQKQKLKVARIHERLAHIRTDYNQKALRTLILERKPSSITIEDLAIRNLMKNRHLSKAISQAQWYKSRSYLKQLCDKFGIELRLVDRFYPSSKLCSNCGYKNKDLKLHERVWTCDECGSTHHRDINAAINLGKSTTYTVLTAV